jgi:hypothetical protein
MNRGCAIIALFAVIICVLVAYLVIYKLLPLLVEGA